MTSNMELEGTWEEYLDHSPDLAGLRVRITILPNDHQSSDPGNGENEGLSPVPTEAKANLLPVETAEARNSRLQRMQAAWEEFKAIPLTEEESDVLDEFEQFRKDHPLRFRATINHSTINY